MNKKIALLLWGCFALLFLTACGRSKTASGGTAVAFNETGFPIVNEPLTLRVIASKHQLTKDYSELPIFQELEQKTGITVKWEYAGSDWSTNKPLLLASGDLPDLFIGTTLNEADIIGNSGMFLELEPLIEKYGDNIKEMFRDDPGLKNFARAYDGKIYGLPMKMPHRPETYQVMSINQNWLDKLNLKMPTTTEEFYMVLKAFKERDPNGNGIADEIPWAPMGFGDNPGIMNLFCPFGVVDSMRDLWLSVTNGRVQYIVTQNGFKEAVTYLHRLYAEGLLDQDVFSNTDWGVWLAKTNPPPGSPEIVGVSGTWARDVNWGEERIRHYPVLLPLKGPDGFQAWIRNTEYVTGKNYMAEIPASGKNPEIIIRWLDCLYDPLVSLELYYGRPAIQNNNDGTYDVLLPPEGSGISRDTFTWSSAWGDLGPQYGGIIEKRIRNDPYIQQYEDKLNYVPYYKEYFPVAAQTPDETDELSILRTDIHGFAQQQTATWIVNGGIEREYDAFIQQLNNMGLSRLVEIYQGIYNRYMGK